MNAAEILELIESVNRRRNDGSVSPIHTPVAHAELLADFDKLISAGYQLIANDKWVKVGVDCQHEWRQNGGWTAYDFCGKCGCNQLRPA